MERIWRHGGTAGFSGSEPPPLAAGVQRRSAEGPESARNPARAEAGHPGRAKLDTAAGPKYNGCLECRLPAGDLFTAVSLPSRSRRPAPRNEMRFPWKTTLVLAVLIGGGAVGYPHARAYWKERNAPKFRTAEDAPHYVVLGCGWYDLGPARRAGCSMTVYGRGIFNGK